VGFGTIAVLQAAPPGVEADAKMDVDGVFSAATVHFYKTSNAAMSECLSRCDVRDNTQDFSTPGLTTSG